jgi:hypothetical protein
VRRDSRYVFGYHPRQRDRPGLDRQRDRYRDIQDYGYDCRDLQRAGALVSDFGRHDVLQRVFVGHHGDDYGYSFCAECADAGWPEVRRDCRYVFGYRPQQCDRFGLDRQRDRYRDIQDYGYDCRDIQRAGACVSDIRRYNVLQRVFVGHHGDDYYVLYTAGFDGELYGV